MSTLNSTFNPAITVDAAPPLKVQRPGNQSRVAFYFIRVGMLFALVAFLSFAVMWVQWQTAVPGISSVSGDFIGFWTAGQVTLQGRAADAYNEVQLFFAQLALDKDPSAAYLGFFYPPYFLLLCAGLALLPYFPALCLWLGATCAGYAAALRAMVPKGLRERESVWVLFLGYPAVMINAGFGQNGFLSTALLGGAAIWLDRQPLLAGICIGCLSYKPQLAIVVPLALAVAGRWRCFAAAAATVLILSAMATLAFGPGIWPAFIANTAEARHNWMEAFNPLYLRYWVTVFGAVRLQDGPLALAYVLQTAAGVAAMYMLVRALWSRPPGARSGRAEIAAVAACIPFCSPYMLEYDLVILAVPMVWLLSEALGDGFRRGEGIVLVFAYLAPVLFKMQAFEAKLSAIAAAALLFVMVLRRMIQGPARPSPAAADLQQPVPAARLEECCAK